MTKPRAGGALLALALLSALAAGCGGDTTGLPLSGISPTPPPNPTGSCGPALAAQDIAGQCRTNPPAMGALEAAG